jgi:hypothetical protein
VYSNRKKKVKKVHKADDNLSREVIEQDSFLAVAGTPKRTTITLPPSL